MLWRVNNRPEIDPALGTMPGQFQDIDGIDLMYFCRYNMPNQDGADELYLRLLAQQVGDVHRHRVKWKAPSGLSIRIDLAIERIS